MQKAVLIYCYDAYCGWCYGFSPIISRLATAYQPLLYCEVVSGGMILPEKPLHIGSMAGYIKQAYPKVEELTGIKFGADYLWHIMNVDDSDWYPNSLKPSIAMCIFKELRPRLQVKFAADLQYALHYEGRDLTDDEAYRHLLARYELNEDDFYTKLRSAEYEDKARYEFAIVKQLQVTGFPTVFIQTGESRFSMVARGFTDYATLKQNIDKVLHSITSDSSFSS